MNESYLIDRSFSYYNNIFVYYDQENVIIKENGNKQENVQLYPPESLFQVLLLSDKYLLCRSLHYLIIYTLYGNFVKLFNFNGATKIVIDRNDHQGFFLSTIHELYYLRLIEDGDLITLEKQLIYQDNDREFIDFDITFTHVTILTNVKSVLILDYDGTFKPNSNFDQLTIPDSMDDCIVQNMKIFCDELNFYLYEEDPVSKMACMFSFSDPTFSKVINNVEAIYSSDFVILNISNRKICINGVSYSNLEMRSIRFIDISYGRFRYFKSDREEDIHFTSKPTMYYPFPVNCYSNGSKSIAFDYSMQQLYVFADEFYKQEIRGAFIKSASLVKDEIIFSVDHTNKLFIYEREDGPRQYQLIESYNTELKPGTEYLQIRPDPISKSFYAILDNSFITFKLSNGRIKKSSTKSFDDKITNFSVSAKYIALFNSSEIYIRPNCDLSEFELFSIDIPEFSHLYVDNNFLYLYDRNNFVVTKINIKTKSIQTFDGVSQVITGDEIGLQLSNMTIVFDKYETIAIEDEYPVASYIHDGKLFRFFNSIQDDENRMSCYELHYKQSIKLPYDEETLYFDKDLHYIFQSIDGNNYYRINNDKPVLCNEDYSRIIVDRYQIVSSKNGELKIEPIFDKNLKADYEEFRLTSPIISMTADIKKPNQFFGLAKNGNLYLFTVDFNDIHPFSYDLIDVQVICFSMSDSKIIILSEDGQISIIKRKDRATNLLSQLNLDNFVRFYNDDLFLYVVYKQENGFSCYMTSINQLNERESIPKTEIHRIWRTSNSNKLVIQYNSGIIVHDADQIPMQNCFEAVAYQSDSLCIWPTINENTRLQSMYSETNKTKTFYNGACAFYFAPAQNLFQITYSNFISKANSENNSPTTLNVQLPADIKSATVISINTVVLSSMNELILFFPPDNSIHIPSPVESLLNLRPHPTRMECFFGVSMYNLYLLTFDGFNITHELIATKVASYSVNKKYLMLEYIQGSNIVICDLNDVNKIKYQFSKESQSPTTAACNYYIDDDFFYVYQYNGIVDLYNFGDTLEKKNSYSNVIGLFSGFSVVLVLTDKRFVFNNKIHHEERILPSSYFAACNKDVCFWPNEENPLHSPLIFQGQEEMKSVINFYYDRQMALFFKRGSRSFCVNNQEYPSNNSFYVLRLANTTLLQIWNGSFIITFLEKEKAEQTNAEKNQMARANQYLSDPADSYRFFAYFEETKEVYLVQILFLPNSRSYSIRHRCYCHDVLSFDVSVNYFVYLDSNYQLNILERKREMPIPIDMPKIILSKDIIPFVDSGLLYLFDKAAKTVNISLVSNLNAVIDTIKNVVSIWNSNGIVVQYQDENGNYYLHVRQAEIQISQKVIAAAYAHPNLCFWNKHPDGNKYVPTVIPIQSDTKNNRKDIVDNITKSFQQLTEKVDEAFMPLEEKCTELQTEFDSLHLIFDELQQIADAQCGIQIDQTEAKINRMSYTDFKLAFNEISFKKDIHPVKTLLYLSKASEILQDSQKTPKEFAFWIMNTPKMMNKLPLDALTQMAAQNLLSRYKELIPNLQQRVLAIPDQKVRKQCSRSIVMLDTILDSLLIES